MSEASTVTYLRSSLAVASVGVRVFAILVEAGVRAIVWSDVFVIAVALVVPTVAAVAIVVVVHRMVTELLRWVAAV